jgi:hypothetical protein
MLHDLTDITIPRELDRLRVMASIPKPDGPAKLTVVLDTPNGPGLASCILTVGETARLIAVLTQALAGAATKYVRRKSVTPRATVSDRDELGGDE